MADQPTLAVRPRALRGKKSRFLRRAGIIPANLYGAGLESMALQAEVKELISTITTTSRNTPIELRIHGESKPRTAFIWKIQRHPVSEEILHVDFYHVEATRTMRTSVPVILENVDPNLEKFAKRVTQYVNQVEVESLPADLPTSITVDATGLQELEDALKVAGLAVSDAVTILTDPEAIVARVTAIVETVEQEEEGAVAAGEAASPEVVAGDASSDEDGD